MAVDFRSLNFVYVGHTDALECQLRVRCGGLVRRGAVPPEQCLVCYERSVTHMRRAAKAAGRGKSGGTRRDLWNETVHSLPLAASRRFGDSLLMLRNQGGFPDQMESISHYIPPSTHTRLALIVNSMVHEMLIVPKY